MHQGNRRVAELPNSQPVAPGPGSGGAEPTGAGPGRSHGSVRLACSQPGGKCTQKAENARGVANFHRERDAGMRAGRGTRHCARSLEKECASDRRRCERKNRLQRAARFLIVGTEILTIARLGGCDFNSHCVNTSFALRDFTSFAKGLVFLMTASFSLRLRRLVVDWGGLGWARGEAEGERGGREEPKSEPIVCGAGETRGRGDDATRASEREGNDQK